MRILETTRAASLVDVSLIRKALVGALSDFKLPRPVIEDLQLAVSEIGANIVAHSRPPATEIAVCLDLDGTGLRLTVRDDGGAFSAFTQAAKACAVGRLKVDASSGRGLTLIHRTLAGACYETKDGCNYLSGRISLRPPAPNILIVEDSPSLLELYQYFLREDFRPIGCASLEEALGVIQSRPVDAVLTDFHLQDGVGTSLLAEYDRFWSATAPPIVLISSDTSERTREEALQQGAEFFVAKPISRDELVRSIHIALDRSNARHLRMMRSFMRHVDDLVAPSLPECFGGYRLKTIAATVECGGGDILLYHRCPAFHRLIVVDVMGHGLAAKAWAVAYAAIIRTLLHEEETDASRFLTRLATVCWNERALESAMATVLVVDIDGDTLTVASAGHPPPIIFGDSTRRVAVRGPLLGVMPPSHYDTQKIALHSGERLVLFTDGVDPADVAAGGATPDWFNAAFEGARGETLESAVATLATAADAALSPRPRDDWLVAVIEREGASGNCQPAYPADR